MYQAIVNEAPGLLLTMSSMGELVKNAELGRKVAAEGFNKLALDPFPQGRSAE
jgi:hypothetical protein